jgi:hypothetical protein
MTDHRQVDHRQVAEEALANAQSNPVMSAEQHFAIAQVHALLAIEERLGELVDEHRASSLPRAASLRVAPESVRSNE